MANIVRDIFDDYIVEYDGVDIPVRIKAKDEDDPLLLEYVNLYERMKEDADQDERALEAFAEGYGVWDEGKLEDEFRRTFLGHYDDDEEFVKAQLLRRGFTREQIKTLETFVSFDNPGCNGYDYSYDNYYFLW